MVCSSKRAQTGAIADCPAVTPPGPVRNYTMPRARKRKELHDVSVYTPLEFTLWSFGHGILCGTGISEKRTARLEETHLWAVAHPQKHPSDDARPVVPPDVSSEVRLQLLHAAIGHRMPKPVASKSEHAAARRVLWLQADVVGAQRVQWPVKTRPC